MKKQKTRRERELEKQVKNIRLMAYILLGVILFIGILTLYNQEIRYPKLQTQLSLCQEAGIKEYTITGKWGEGGETVGGFEEKIYVDKCGKVIKTEMDAYGKLYSKSTTSDIASYYGTQICFIEEKNND